MSTVAFVVTYGPTVSNDIDEETYGMCSACFADHMTQGRFHDSLTGLNSTYSPVTRLTIEPAQGVWKGVKCSIYPCKG